MFNLTCIVTEDEALSGVPDVTWYGPSGEVTPSYHDSITLVGPTTSGDATTLVLEIHPVMFGVGGSYRCEAMFGSDPPQMRSRTIEVVVGSRFAWIIVSEMPSYR